MKNKVLYVSPNGFVGGAEAFVLEITKSHKKSNKYEIINMFFNDGDAVTISQKNDIETILLKNKFKLSHPLKLLKAILEIRQILKEKQINLIHSTMPYAHIVMSLSSFGLGIQKVWFQHGPVDGILDKIGKWFKVECVMYNSEFLKEEHDKLAGFNAIKKDIIIPLGIDEKIVKEPKVDDFLRSDEQDQIIIGVAGRINRFKGYHIFIKAIEIIKNELDESIFKRCIFPIIGGANSEEDKKYLNELNELARAQKMENKISFLGHKSNINDYLKIMDVFLHCSPDREAISIVAAEAMLQSTLVVGSGIDDIVKDGKTGFECNTNIENPEILLGNILKEIINNISKEKDFYKDIKKEAYNLIKQNYSKESMTNLVEITYAELLSENTNNSIHS